jgi:adenosine deaminase
MDWKKLPKVELHLHLDCSLSYEVVSQIDPSVTHEVYHADFVPPADCTDLADALRCAPSSFPLMQTQEHLRLVTFDLFEQLRAENTLYAELRFAPLLHTDGGLSPHQVVATVERAVAEAIRNTGVEARLILCTVRRFSEAQSLETARLADRFRGTHVAAFDLAGDEAGFPLDAHLAAFRFARDRGIPRTAHAGEGAGPESVWEVLEHADPWRLGHGVHSIQDPALLDHLRRRKIHLEVCPTSNVLTRAFDTFADHPIDVLYRSGLSVGVNSDARTLVPTTLSREYTLLHETFGWDAADFLQCNKNALQAAFLPSDVRDRLLAQLAAGYEPYL